MDITAFAERIDQSDKGWRVRGGGYPIVVLHSCASSEFAQEISKAKEFKDVIIIAPDATLESSRKGEHVRSIVYGKKFEKKRDGAWHVFMNGVPLRDKKGNRIQYGADEQPGSKGFNYRLNLEETKKKKK